MFLCLNFAVCSLIKQSLSHQAVNPSLTLCRLIFALSGFCSNYSLLYCLLLSLKLQRARTLRHSHRMIIMQPHLTFANFFSLYSFSVLLHLFNHGTVVEVGAGTFSLCRTEYHFLSEECGGGVFLLLVSAPLKLCWSLRVLREKKRRCWQAQASCQLVYLSLHELLLLGVSVQVRFRICQRDEFSFHCRVLTHKRRLWKM